MSEWATKWRRKYELILFFFFPDFFPLSVFVSFSSSLVSRLSSLSIFSPYIYGRIRDRNSYLLTSVSIKASAVDKLKNVNKTTKQPSERAKTKCNTHDSCHLILSVVVLPNTKTSTVLFYIEYRNGRS